MVVVEGLILNSSLRFWLVKQEAAEIILFLVVFMRACIHDLMSLCTHVKIGRHGGRLRKYQNRRASAKDSSRRFPLQALTAWPSW